MYVIHTVYYLIFSIITNKILYVRNNETYITVYDCTVYSDLCFVVFHLVHFVG